MYSKIREALEESTKLLGDILRTVETHREDRIKRVMCQNGAAISLLTAKPEPCEDMNAVFQRRFCVSHLDMMDDDQKRLYETFKAGWTVSYQVSDKRAEDLRAENERFKARIEEMQHMIGLVLQDEKRLGGISQFRLIGLLPPSDESLAATETKP